MLKTLRITGIVSVAAAAAGVLFVLVFGLRSDAKIEGLLALPSIVEQLKKTDRGGTQEKDMVSPLVSQAKAFALRINPPPPPPPPPAPKPKDGGEVQTATDVVQPNRAFSGKFDLLATAQYAKYPERSLALLELVAEGQKWYRQGESVGRFKIQEVKEGSIVLFQNGKFDSEMFVPLPPPSQSLLKSDQNNPVSSRRPYSPPAAVPQDNAKNAVPAAADGVEPVLPTQARQSQIPTGTVRMGRRMPARPEVSQPQPVSEPEPQPEREPTHAERVAAANESIAGIKQIMNESVEGQSDAEREEQNKAWADLLKVLEEEKKTLENAPEANTQSAGEKSAEK